MANIDISQVSKDYPNGMRAVHDVDESNGNRNLQVGFGNAALRLEQVRQVRVIVDGDAVRVGRDHFVEGGHDVEGGTAPQNDAVAAGGGACQRVQRLQRPAAAQDAEPAYGQAPSLRRVQTRRDPGRSDGRPTTRLTAP